MWNMKVTVIPIVIGSLGTVVKGLVRGLNDLEMKKSGDHSNFYIIEIGENAKKSLCDLRRLAVTQTSVKDHQLTLI